MTGSTSNVCACNAGSTGSDGAGVCVSCAFGTYKTDPGSASCTGCEVGKFSAVTGLVSNVCACNARSTGSDGVGVCASFAFGTYKTNPGSVACTVCGAGKFSAVTVSVLNVCTCNAGSTGSDGAGACTLCVFSTYKTNPGSVVCTGCGACKFFAVTGSVSNVCACNAGSTGPNGFATCKLCAFSTYRVEPGSASCTLCATGKSSAVTGSVSNVCACSPGTTGPDGFASFVSCSFGTYKSDLWLASSTQCGTGKNSLVTGSFSNVCTCNPGTTGPDGFETCVSCVFGKYKIKPGAVSCTLRAEGKFSAVTGSVSNVCTCNAGWTGSDGFGTCLSCSFGTYKKDPRPALCTGCGDGKFAAVSGSISNVCACNAGSTGPDGFGGCSSCAFSTYKTGPG